MAPNSSNTNTVKHIDKVGVELKFEDDPENNRTWVDKGSFPEFHNAYEDSQENSPLNNSPQVQFRVKATIRNTATKKEETKTALVEMTTVYGGTEGVKLFLKTKSWNLFINGGTAQRSIRSGNPEFVYQ